MASQFEQMHHLICYLQLIFQHQRPGLLPPWTLWGRLVLVRGSQWLSGASMSEWSLTWELLKLPSPEGPLLLSFLTCVKADGILLLETTFHTSTPPLPHPRHNQLRFLATISVHSWFLTIWHHASFAPLLCYLDKMAKIHLRKHRCKEVFYWTAFPGSSMEILYPLYHWGLIQDSCGSEKLSLSAGLTHQESFEP